MPAANMRTTGERTKDGTLFYRMAWWFTMPSVFLNPKRATLRYQALAGGSAGGYRNTRRFWILRIALRSPTSEIGAHRRACYRPTLK